jgi:hypothetical protein
MAHRTRFSTTNIKKQPAAAFFTEYQSLERLFKQVIELVNDPFGDGIGIFFEIKGQNRAIPHGLISSPRVKARSPIKTIRDTSPPRAIQLWAVTFPKAADTPPSPIFSLTP